MLIVLIAQKNSDSESGFGLIILEYSRIVYYFEGIDYFAVNGNLPSETILP